MHTAQQHTPPQQGNPSKNLALAYFYLSPDLDGEFHDDSDDSSDTCFLCPMTRKMVQLVLFGWSNFILMSHTSWKWTNHIRFTYHSSVGSSLMMKYAALGQHMVLSKS